MRYLEDKNTGLVIVSPEIEVDENGDYYSPEEETFEDLYKELDSWNAKNIRTYVTSGVPLGEYLKEHRNKRRTHYFVFEDGVLSGTTLVESSGLLAQYVILKGYVGYCEKNNKPEGIEGYLSIENALRVLKEPTNQCIIDFLAVKKEAQGKGIGTKIVKTISDNLEHFTGKSSSVLNAFIYEDNYASIKAFEKNGFQKPFRWYDNEIYAGFDTYYKVVDKEKEDEDVNTK